MFAIPSILRCAAADGQKYPSCGHAGQTGAGHAEVVEEIQRAPPAASSQVPPDLGALFSSILSGIGGGSSSAPGGEGNAASAAPAALHAPGGGGGLMGILGSPAFQQMAGQLLNGPLGAGLCLLLPGYPALLPGCELLDNAVVSGTHIRADLQVTTTNLSICDEPDRFLLVRVDLS